MPFFSGISRVIRVLKIIYKDVVKAQDHFILHSSPVQGSG